MLTSLTISYVDICTHTVAPRPAFEKDKNGASFLKICTGRLHCVCVQICMMLMRIPVGLASRQRQFPNPYAQLRMGSCKKIMSLKVIHFKVTNSLAAYYYIYIYIYIHTYTHTYTGDCDFASEIALHAILFFCSCPSAAGRMWTTLLWVLISRVLIYYTITLAPLWYMHMTTKQNMLSCPDFMVLVT